MSIYKGNSLVAGGSQVLPLLTFIWSDCIKNHPSWLRADTFSWQSGAVYQAAYQHLVDDYNNVPHISISYTSHGYTNVCTRNEQHDIVSSGVQYYAWEHNEISDYFVYTTSAAPGIGSTIYNSNLSAIIPTVSSFVAGSSTETISGVTITYYQAPDGHKLVLLDQESNVTAIYNATGVAWYYILDTTNQRFKLPRTKFGFTGIRSGVGGYVKAGLPNITGSSYGYVSSANRGASGALQMSGGGGKDATGGGGWWVEGVTVSVDASESNSIYGASDTVQPKATEMYLYFYVGNFTQTALENTAGLNAELFNGKADVSTVAHVVTEFQEPTSANNYTWYRKYADGWVEQGGYRTSVSNTIITLPVPMADTNYTLIKTLNNDYQGNRGGYTWGSGTAVKISATQIRLNQTDGGDMQSWQVSGMAA